MRIEILISVDEIYSLIDKGLLASEDTKVADGGQTGTNAAATSGTGRRAPTPAELDAMVAVQCDAWVANKTPFSAYKVTKELQRANPTLEILHADVQSRVHSYMGGMHSDVQWSDDPYGSNVARTYHPEVAPVATPAPAQKGILARIGWLLGKK